MLVAGLIFWLRYVHDGKGMENYDVAQTAGMAKTRGDHFSHISGIWMINIYDTQWKPVVLRIFPRLILIFR